MLKKFFTTNADRAILMFALLFLNCFSVFSQANLPTSYNGTWFGGTPPTGWSWNMTNADTPGANFNGIGRQMQIDFSCTPFSISFDITPNTLNAGVSKVILVEQFVGGSWVTLATYSWNGSVASPAGLGVLGAPSTLSQTLLLNSSATSVRFNMTVRDAGVGNYGISNVSVMGDPSCGPVLYTTPGTYSWIVPTCVDEITVQAWGGGGGGGAVWSRWDDTCGDPGCQGAETCQCAGGGGGGGFAQRTYSVVGGQVYTINVGARGTRGTVNGSGDNRAHDGSDGGNSTFSGPATTGPGTLIAFGGTGGGAANNMRDCFFDGCFGHEGANGVGGSGGGAANGTVMFTGGNGRTGQHSGSSNDRSGAGGGGAGTTSNGGNGGLVAAGTGGTADGGNGGAGINQAYNSGYLGTNGNNASTIGGGGGGAAQHNRIGFNRGSALNHVTQLGGHGARGEVRILYNNTCTVLLPIELLSFDGKNINEINALEWYTATESSNDYFTVYRTINGIDWESVGIVSGGGTTQYKQRYLLDDRGFNKGMINYYRLSQTDTDGNIEFIGKIIQIDNRFSNQKIVKSYNIMGQEILPDSKGVVINLFEDGSTQRVYND